MSPQSLVFNLDLCRLLKEKGVEVETWFWWYKIGDGEWHFGGKDEVPEGIFVHPEVEYCAAPTLSEAAEVFRKLGEIYKWQCHKCEAGCNLSACYCECDKCWRNNYLEFCRLWAESKEKAENYLANLLA